MRHRIYLLFIFLAFTSSLSHAAERQSLSAIITSFAQESNLDTLEKQQAFIITMLTFNDLAIEASRLALSLVLDDGAFDRTKTEAMWKLIYRAMDDFTDYATALKTAAGHELEIFGDSVLKPSIEEIVSSAHRAVLDPSNIQDSFKIIANSVLTQLSIIAPHLLPSIYNEALAQLSTLNNNFPKAFWGPFKSLSHMVLMDWPSDIQIFLNYFFHAPDFIINDKQECSILLRAGSSNNCIMALIPGSSNAELPMAFLDTWELVQHIVVLNWPSHIRIFLEPWLDAITNIKNI
jgi:hypothetical protein